MDEQFLKDFEAMHIAAWNEKDSVLRDELIEKIYAPDIIMYDAQNVFHGRQAISDFISQLLRDDPQFHFSGLKPIESLHNGARLFGQIRTTAVVFNSMDFFIFDNNLVKLLYAFMEPVQ